MCLSLSRRVKAIAVVIAAVAVLSPMKAFTASNTLSEGHVGEGAGAISGFTVSDVHYDLSLADAHTIAKVAFTLDETPASGASIQARLSPSGTWYPCTVAGADVACDTSPSPVTVRDAIELTVVAVQ